MNEVDLVGIGSYTELPGGNVTLEQGYSALLGPLLENIPEQCVLKQHAIKHIHWRYRVEMEEGKNDKGYEITMEIGNSYQTNTIFNCNYITFISK